MASVHFWRTYKRLYQIVEVLEVLPDDHIAKYKKLDEAEEQQHKKTDSDPNKDDRKRKALWIAFPSYFDR